MRSRIYFYLTIFSSFFAISSVAMVSIILLGSTKMAFAQQAEWSPWQAMNGVPLSLKYIQINPGMCALAFRNDSGRTIYGAQLRYVHSGRVDTDILPEIGPGQVLGGWTAFSVNDLCQNVQVQISNIAWN